MKWPVKHNNKDVKMTLQVCWETAGTHTTIWVCVWLLRLCCRYPAACLVSMPPTPTSPPRSASTRTRASPGLLPLTQPSCRRTSVEWPPTVSYVWLNRTHWAWLLEYKNPIVIWLTDYGSDRVKQIMWHALSGNSSYQITRKRINTPRFLPLTSVHLLIWLISFFYICACLKSVENYKCHLSCLHFSEICGFYMTYARYFVPRSSAKCGRSLILSKLDPTG